MSDVLARVWGWVRRMLTYRRDTYISLFSPYSRSSAFDHDERRRQEESRSRLLWIEQELDRIQQLAQRRDPEQRQ